MRRKLIVIFGLVLMLLMCTAAVSFAADKPYKYHVKIYAGEQGSFDGKKMVEFEYDPTKTDLHVRHTLDSLGFKLENDKYYPRGFRVAGHDNDEISGYQAIAFDQLTEDKSYEVAYGIKGSLVAYTVHYYDEDGNELLPSETYYGMAGDKPVVAGRYVANYEPQAYTLGKTLSENEADNEFTFTYTRANNNQNQNNNNNNNNNNPANPAAPANRPAPAAAPGTAANPAGTNNPAANNPGATANIGDNDTPLSGPQQYSDLDEGETPLAEPDEGGHNYLPILIGSAVGILILLALLLWFLKRRKSGEDEA